MSTVQEIEAKIVAGGTPTTVEALTLLVKDSEEKGRLLVNRYREAGEARVAALAEQDALGKMVRDLDLSVQEKWRVVEAARIEVYESLLAGRDSKKLADKLVALETDHRLLADAARWAREVKKRDASNAAIIAEMDCLQAESDWIYAVVHHFEQEEYRKFFASGVSELSTFKPPSHILSARSEVTGRLLADLEKQHPELEQFRRRRDILAKKEEKQP